MNINALVINEYPDELNPSSRDERLILSALDSKPIHDPRPTGAYCSYFEEFLRSSPGKISYGHYTIQDTFESFGTYEEKSIVDYIDRLMVGYNLIAWSIQFVQQNITGSPLSCYINYYNHLPPDNFSSDIPPHTRHTWNFGHGEIHTVRSY